MNTRRAASLLLIAGFCSFSSVAFSHGSRGHQGPDADLIAARQKLFGIENVDRETGAVAKDKVIFSWISNASFAASIRGRIVLLDTFVTRIEVTPGRTPFVIKDLVDLKPEAILLGHGHFDHADNAAYIAAKTGAEIYATQETCGVMRQDLARMLNDPVIQGDPVAKINPNAAIKCTDVTTAGSVPGTQLVRLRVLEPEMCVLAFRHLHSVAVPPDPDFAPTPVRIIVDPRDAELFPLGIRLTPNAPRLPGQMDLRTAGEPGGAESLFFHFVMREEPHFTFAWHNTAGALKEGKGSAWNGTPEDGQRLVKLLRSLPQTDLQMGTASTGNFINNGLRDLIMYQEALKPRIYIPNHVTSGTQTREASSMSVYAGYLKQLQNMEAPVGQWPGYSREEWPDIRWLIDPTDYARPIVFDTNDREWRDRDSPPARWPNWEKQSRVRQFCGGR